MKETKSLSITTQMNAIKINYIKAKIDDTTLNSKWRLCRDRNEKFDHRISEYSILVKKKYKTTHDWVRKDDLPGIVQKIKIW